MLLLARLLLAGVFLVAGLAKLADLKGSRQAMRDFGMPTLLAAPFGVLLPLAELAVGIALLPTLSAWWAAIGALALLLLFVGGISYNLARGRQPDCHCFGQLYSRPIGWPTLMRNLLLAAVAGFIVGFGWNNAGVDFFALPGSLALAQRIELAVGVVLVALIAIEGWVLLQMLRQQGRLLLRMEALEARLASNGSAAPAAPPVVETPAAPGLPVGSSAPAFVLSGLYGETLTLEALRARGKPVTLVFSDPGCGPCNALMPEMGRWQREYADKLTFALISRGSVEDNRAKVSEHSIMHVLLQKDREIAESYQVVGTPSAVLVRPDGMIGSSLAQGADEIRGMVAGAVGIPILRSLPVPTPPAPTNGNGNGAALPVVAAQPGQPAVAKVGEQAPDFSLPDLSGKTVRLSDFRGSRTLVLFWRPSCGFCQRMLDDLKAWEAAPPAGAPRLLVVSTDSTQDNEAMGLRSPLVLDQGGMTIGSKFGANGTPMAVLVDADGRIASELAVGAQQVLGLAGVENAAVPTSQPSQLVAVAPKVGEPAPDFSLPDVTGKTIRLSNYRGSKMLLLFWDPGCGFCQQMLDDLKAWEAQPPKGAPKLLVVSTGSAETNSALGLRSRVLLDQSGMSVGSKFGANGTPMAVLVDARGKIASELAAGAPQVLALAGAANGVDLA